VTRERRQPRRIAALLVLVTNLALISALHVHLPGAASPEGVAVAASHAGEAATHVSLPCQLCQVGRHTRYATAAGSVPAPAAPASPALRLAADERPTAPGAPLRLGAPPRAPPVLLS